jgi:hypothetical protein
MKRAVLLNAFPVSAFAFQQFAADFQRISLQQLAIEVRDAEVANYIRHPGTVAAISKALGRELKPVAGFSTYTPNDSIYVVTLKQLPARGAEVATIKEEELDILRVQVYPLWR